MNPIGLAVCGAGIMGRSHIARIDGSPNCTLAGVVDPVPAALAPFAARAVPVFADVGSMLDETKPDGLIVASPNHLHRDHALAAIARGIPVLVEKPIADTSESAATISAAAETARVAVLVGHHRRHNPILQRAREIVATGTLGRIATVTALVTFLKPDAYFDVAWRREPGGGPVLINLIHAVDDLRFLLGDIAQLQAMTSNAIRGFAVEDSVAVMVRFETGALGTITASDTAAGPWSWELTSGENAAYPSRLAEDCYLIGGTQGALAVPSLRHWRYRGARGWNAPLEEQRHAVEPADPLIRQLDHFCAVIRGEAAPLVTAADAARTLAATLAIGARAEPAVNPP